MDQIEKNQQIQSTIAALEAQRAVLGDQVVDASIAALQKQIAGQTPAHSKERKLVSILFCDIVGSSSIAANHDPEEVLTIVNDALQEMNQAVEKFGGTVTRYMGDGILAVFGAPKALERHAEQAIRAGLAIQERMAAYAERLVHERDLPDFQVRVGINSGHVVGGDVGGEQGEYTVIGDAVNMAARFEAAAPPGTVLAGQTTFQLAGGERILESEAWAPIVVKGSSKPQSVYLIHRLRPVLRLPGTVQAPLTGRSSELSALQNSFQQVDGQQKLALIRVIGPAGIGKSRLGYEFNSWLESLPHPPQIIIGRALAFTGRTPYALASSLLHTSFGILDTDPMEQRREKLLLGWQEVGGLSQEQLHGLATLTSIKLEKNELDALDLQARRDLIFESFVTYWQRRAERSTLVLILEDIHWADDLSLDLVEELVNARRASGLLLIFFTRPERRHDGRFETLQSQLGASFLNDILLQELDSGQTGNLVQGLLDSRELPPDLIQAIDDKAQGNPFFIEEIVNSLLEDGSLLNQDGAWKLTRDLAGTQVPDTVQGVLAARIDRLDADDKQILQHAAIIGRSFAQKVLAGLFDSGIDEPLEHLRERDFIIKSEQPAFMDDWEWLFRHVLVQEVAYESVLLEMRRKIHGRIALNLETLARDRVDELAPTMAHHFQRGHIWDRAVFYLVHAAERSARMFALLEALSFFDRAIDLTEAHPDDIKGETRLDLFEKRGDVRALAYEFDGAEMDFQVSLAAARRSGDRQHEQNLLVRLGFLFRTADRLEEAVEYLQAGLEVARQIGDLHAVADTLYHIGTVAWTNGNNKTALSYQQEAVEICRQLGFEDIVAVQALHGLAEAQLWAGSPRQAVDSFQESIKLARLIGEKSYECENLYMLAYACQKDWGTGDHDLAFKSVQGALDISRKARLDGHTVPALLVSGGVYASAGDYQTGLNNIIEAIAWSENLGVFRFQTAAYLILGALYRELNLFAEARDADERGLKIAVDYDIGFNRAGLHAGVAIDRLYQGDLTVQQDLLTILQQAQENGLGMHVLDCYKGLAAWALAVGEWQQALHYAQMLAEIAQAGGQREMTVRAGLIRAAALSALGEWQKAENELQNVQKNIIETTSIRLKWDVHAALEKLYRLWDKEEQADHERAQVAAITAQIRANLQDEKLKSGLPTF